MMWQLPSQQLADISGPPPALVVLDGDPLENFEEIQNIRLRVKDGELLAPADGDS